MAKITTQFAFFKTKAAFNTQMSGDGISDTTIVFIKDTQEIFTHGAKICSMQDIMTLLATDYLSKKGGEITGDLSVGGNIDANGNLHTYGTVSVESGSNDDILMADGSFQSLQAIKNLISAIPKFHTMVVNALPADEEYKSESTIYLVKSGDDAQNLYTEYIWINGAWEELGTQRVNLDGYLNTSNTTLSISENTENEIDLEINHEGFAFASTQLPIASPTMAGLMSTTDKTKLDKLKTDFDVHTHDDRYYTEDEINQKLSSKSDTNHTHDFSSITNKPTTAAGYGITDAITSVDDYGDTSSHTIELTNVAGETRSIVIGSADKYEAGLMSVADKAKLDLISWYEGN